MAERCTTFTVKHTHHLNGTKNFSPTPEKIGITIFSTAFDESAVDLLISLDTPAFKIASFEITDLTPLGIRRV